MIKYTVLDNKLIIIESPCVLTKDLITQILSECDNQINVIEILNGVEIIDYGAFSCNDDLVLISLPDSLKEIRSEAFYCCTNLKEISIPQKVINIEEKTFENCKNLEKVSFGSDLKEIDDYAFYGCKRLEEIVLPDNLRKIGKSSFYGCKLLKEIIIPQGVDTIEKEAFSHCQKLEHVQFNFSLKVISERAFSYCDNIKNVYIPDSVFSIEKGAFLFCKNLISVRLPANLKEINDTTFLNCRNLLDVNLSENLEILGFGAFSGCSSLTSINTLGGINKIGDFAFFGCCKLNNIVLPKCVKEIGEYAFSCCSELDNIDIDDNVEIIRDYAFECCSSLKKFNIPKNLNEFGEGIFNLCDELDKFVFYDGKEIKIGQLKFINNFTRKLFLYDVEQNLYMFYDKNKIIKFKKSMIDDNQGIVRIRKEYGLETMSNLSYYIYLYYWCSKKFIPHYIVVKSMNINDIDNFYINNNGIEWAKLIKLSNIQLDVNKSSFFKLCYVLGVFNSKASIRDMAVKFIKENIIGKMEEEHIHSRFDGFDLSNGYNEEYAEFFMRYFNNTDFMLVSENGEEHDLLAASYNNFSKIKNIYPNKEVNTNREADILLPIHVIASISSGSYENVEKGNEEFANMLGRYGYTQRQFEVLQELFNEGKKIKRSNIKLFIKDDIGGEINYKLLDKDNPLGAVLGNITNCCQIIGGAGEDCVKYGLSKPNSKFMTFNYHNTIIGQSWVWYDEYSKTICLDNIEVPRKFINVIKNNEGLQDAFVECLIRVSNSFKEEMIEKGFVVEHVTIGRGFNDIKSVLDNNFNIIKNINKLSDYTGYSDADVEQYEIIKRK